MLALARKPGVQLIKLEENFRSRAEICDAANRLIAHNTNRVAKETRSFKGEGGKVYAALPCMNEGEELSAVARTIKRWEADQPGKSFAVLARTNFIADAYRKGLAAAAIKTVERTTSDLPRDWAYARGLVELLVYPENDVLAFFYLIGMHEKEGDTPKVAREKAHTERKYAHAAGKTINQAKVELETAMSERRRDLELKAALPAERTDFTLPGRRRPLGKLHPLTQVTEEIVRSFRKIGFAVADGAIMNVTPPSWRSDVDGSADLVEEVVRIFGLEHVPSAPMSRPHAIARPVLTSAQRRTKIARRSLAARGFNETVSFSFVPRAHAALFGGGDDARQVDEARQAVVVEGQVRARAVAGQAPHSATDGHQPLELEEAGPSDQDICPGDADPEHQERKRRGRSEVTHVEGERIGQLVW